MDVAWNEAVNSARAGAFTASEIMCRKILMHVAVDKTGVDKGKAFTEYIDALDSAGYIPTGLKPKIDEIRTRETSPTTSFLRLTRRWLTGRCPSPASCS